jgi:hypothetical protein
MEREVMTFLVKDKEIWYTNRTFKKQIRCFPKDKEFLKMIIISRNKYPKELIKMFNITKAEQKEYDETCLKGEEALADKIIFDCQSKGLRLLNKEVENAVT